MTNLRATLLGAIAAGALLAAGGQASADTAIFANYTTPITGPGSGFNLRWVNNGPNNTGTGGSLFTIATPSATVFGAAPGGKMDFTDWMLGLALADVPVDFRLSASVVGTPASFDPSSGTYTQTGITGYMDFFYKGADSNAYGTTTVTHNSTLLHVAFTNAWIQGAGGVGGLDVTVNNGGNAIFTSDYTNFAQLDPGTEEFTLHLAAVAPAFGKNAGKALKNFRAHGAGDFQYAVVPEPTTWSLMILGLGGAGAALRSTRRQRRTLVSA